MLIRWVGSIVAIACGLAGCAGPGASTTPQSSPRQAAAASDVAAIKNLIADYISRLNAGDVEGIANRTFWTPMQTIAGNGQVTVSMTPADLAENWRQFLARLKSTSGATTFSATVENVCFLSPTLALVSYRSVRAKETGEVASEASWAYPVVKRGNEWRIAASIPRSPGVTISCSDR